MPFVGRRVLLAEDEFLAALTTIDLLESIGWEVVGPTGRVASALRFARSEPLDAAVLDINVAGEMIWPVAQTLQRRGVPFVFLSALSERNAIPPLFADVPRLAKPLVQACFLHHLATIITSPWGGGTLNSGFARLRAVRLERH